MSWRSYLIKNVATAGDSFGARYSGMRKNKKGLENPDPKTLV
jgi:hypothetical protein